MNRFKNKFLSVALSAAMVASMLSPMGAQAAVLTSGDEWITTSNGLEVKFTTQYNGETGEGVIADTADAKETSAGDAALLFDGDSSTGVNLRNSLSAWAGEIQVGDYIQVDFKEAIELNDVAVIGASGNCYGDATLSYTTDGEAWETLVTYSGDVSSLNYIAEDVIEGVTAIKLTNGAAKSKWVTLYEIKVNGIEEGSAEDSRKDLALDKFTYSAGSVEEREGNEGPVKLAFDNNLSTYWHSSWTCPFDVNEYQTEMPKYFWVQMDFTEATVVDAVRYLSRGDGNGDITGYRIEGTADGETWTELTAGSWEYGGSWKIATFDAVELLGVRLVATETTSAPANQANNNKFANAKEIRVRTAELAVTVDRTALEEAIEEASNLVEEEYTADSWAVLVAAVEVAEALAEDATQEEVNEAAAAIIDAIDALEEYVPVDTTILAVALERAEALVEEEYTAESWAVLAAAVEAAEALTADATQEEVDAAALAINAAIDALVDAPAPVEPVALTVDDIKGVTSNGTFETSKGGEGYTDATSEEILAEVYDGSNTTFWNSAKVTDLNDAYLTFELDGTFAISKVEFSPRWHNDAKWACTGNIKELVVEVSEDGTTWTTQELDVTEKIAGTDAAAFPVELTFDAVEANYVRVKATASHHWQQGQTGQPDNRNTSITIGDVVFYGTAVEAEPTPTETPVVTPTEEVTPTETEEPTPTEEVTPTETEEPVVEPTNVALNKTVTAANMDGTAVYLNLDGGPELANLTDGGLRANPYDYVEIGYTAANETTKGISYLQVDLEKVYDISELKMWRYFSDSRVYGETVVAIAKDEADFPANLTDADYAATVVYNSDVESETFFEGNFGKGTDATYAESEAGYTITLDETVAGRYVRIYLTGRDNNNRAHVVELEVYGVEAKAEPTPTETQAPTPTETQAPDPTEAPAAADKTALNELIEATKAMDITGIDPMDVLELMAALADAQSVADKADATQDEVDAAVAALTAVVEELKKPAVTPTETEAPAKADKTALEAAVNEANALNPYDYADFTAVMDAITAGFAVLDKADATQAEVDEAVAALEAAVAALTPAATPTATPTATAEPTAEPTTAPEVTPLPEGVVFGVRLLDGTDLPIKEIAAYTNYYGESATTYEITVPAGTEKVQVIIQDGTEVYDEYGDVKRKAESLYAFPDADWQYYMVSADGGWTPVVFFKFVEGELPTPTETEAPVPTETEAPQPTATPEVPTETVYVEIDGAILAANAMANSEQNPAKDNDGPAAWAFDENNNWWHSRWGGEPASHEVPSGKPEDNAIWIQTGFGEALTIGQVTYVARPTRQGVIKDYTISVANLEDPAAVPTDDDFTVIKTDVMACTTDAQTVTFDAVEATHIRITVTSVYQGWDTDGTDLGNGFIQAKTIKVYEAKEVPVTPTETEAPQPTETEAPVPTETEAPVPTETEAPVPTETEAPVPTETEAPQPTETEAPQPTETPGVTEDVKTVFTDVYKDWYTDYVQYVYDNGLMTGIKGTTEFQPNANITKAQVAQVLYNMEGQPDVTDQKVFTELNDVYSAEWYAAAVAWAYNNGVVTGDLNTKKFNPNADVTREQLALMMFRYAGYKGYDVTATSDYEGLVNADKVNNWAAEGMSWAVGAGLISGIEKDGVKDLAPQGNASRAQVAAILQRFCENVK